MEIYIGDGEYAEAPGDDPADAYDAWLEKICEDNATIDQDDPHNDEWDDEDADG